MPEPAKKRVNFLAALALAAFAVAAVALLWFEWDLTTDLAIISGGLAALAADRL